MKYFTYSIRIVFLVLVAFNSENITIAQCVSPVITAIGNSGPVCEGGTIQLSASGTINGVSSSYVRMAGIGGNFGNRAFDQVFAYGDRPGSITRISNTAFDAIFASASNDADRAALIKAQYDVIMFTWASPEDVHITWSLITAYLNTGGSIFVDGDYQNVDNLYDGTNASLRGVADATTGGCNYTLVSPAPFPVLVANGVAGCFDNDHLSIISFPSWMQVYIKVGSKNLAVAGIYPYGNHGRLIVQGPDQDYHANKFGDYTDRNQYQIILNQMDFLTANQAGFSWTGPNGFVSNEANPIISGVTAANAGTYTVTLTNVTDGGCSVSATTEVVVNPKPVVQCPSNIIVNADPETCGAIVNFPAATISNGAPASINYSKNSGTLFPIGTTTVTVTASNSCGTGSCNFTVIVNDAAPVPNVTTLPDLNDECSLTVSTIPTATDNCKGQINAITDDPLSYSEQGEYIIHWKYDDDNGNIATQQQKVIIKDVTGPTIMCPDPITVNNDVNTCGAVVNYQLPSISDNCSVNGQSQTITLNAGCNDGTITFSMPAATNVNKLVYGGSGINGNVHGHGSNVTITTELYNAVTHDWVLVQTINTGSGEYYYDGTTVTFPTIPQVTAIRFTASRIVSCAFHLYNLPVSLVGSNEVILNQTEGLPSGSTFPLGNTTNTFVATDAVGNTSTCSFTITVKDNQAPAITCPAPTTISCDASIDPSNTGTATATDNCDGNPTITYSDVSTKGSDPLQSNYYNYIITRTWKAEDAAHNVTTCNQTITVQDVTNPTAKCKSIELYLGLDGTVSITASQVDDGSFDNCSPVSLGVSPNSFNTTNIGANTVTLTVTDVSGNSSSCQATVTVKKRPTTLVYTGDGSEQYSDQQLLTAELRDQLTNTVLSSKLVSFAIGSQLTSGTTDANGIASTNLIITQDPAPVCTVKSKFDGDVIFLPSSDEDAFDILQEDARAYYTGALMASTSGTNGSSAIVTLSATIKDISAVSGDPAYDAFKGDIRNATVTFINRDNNTVLAANVPVGLINVSDLTVGTATKNVTLNINGDAQQFTIGIIVNNYYTRNASAENTIVTVSKPLDNFITGGGYIVLTDKSAGQKAGTQATNNNFGFNVKYNKSNTNLQGNMNTIIRRMESDGLHVYQIKGNSMTSLAVNSGVSTSKTATFNGKASIQDITNPLAPAPVDGNAILQVTMTDRGEPGNTDDIGITVWNKTGGLWYTSNWNGTKTVNQMLAGGNLKISGASYNASASAAARINTTALESEKTATNLIVNVLPNPASHQFTMNIKGASSAIVRITDVSGRLIEAKDGVSVNTSFSFGSHYRPGVYFAQVIQGDKTVVIKLIKGSD